MRRHRAQRAKCLPAQHADRPDDRGPNRADRLPHDFSLSGPRHRMVREARSAQGVHPAAAMPGSDHFAEHGFLIAKGDEVNLGVALEWLAVAAPWAIRIGALIVVPFRRSPAATQSWLLLFFVAPWFALILYLAIGRPSHPRWRRQRVAQLWPIIERAVSRIDRVVRPAELPLVQASAASLVSGIGRMPLLQGNEVDLLTDYDATIDLLVEDIWTCNGFAPVPYLIMPPWPQRRVG